MQAPTAAGRAAHSALDVTPQQNSPAHVCAYDTFADPVVVEREQRMSATPRVRARRTSARRTH